MTNAIAVLLTRSQTKWKGVRGKKVSTDRKGNDKIEPPSNGRSITHSDIPNIKRERFCRISERNGSFTHTVGDSEEVDSESDDTNSDLFGWDEEGETGDEEEESHEGDYRKRIKYQ